MCPVPFLQENLFPPEGGCEPTSNLVLERNHTDSRQLSPDDFVIQSHCPPETYLAAFHALKLNGDIARVR